ncbi:MAG: hypothetical protein IJS10_00350 [Alphaproteobacteria bacterium]|nr:hypothetical protein [Alphaproteobacteria bacterium]
MDDDHHHLNLFEAVVMLENSNEVADFLKDLCTPQELKALQERWEVCQLLADGELSYRQISKQTGSSTTTIGRVSRFLNDEPYKGYRKLLDKIKKEKRDVQKNIETVDSNGAIL